MQDPTVDTLSRNGHTPQDLDNVWTAKPALICDLDGTLRYNKNDPPESGPRSFINDAGDIAFYDHVIEALWRYREDGFLIAIVTNQGGMAHGHMGMPDWHRQQGRMQELATEIDDRGMPTHMTLPAFCMEEGSEDLYSYASLRRKPAYGNLAILENQARMNNARIKWGSSYVIGDRTEDKEMATAAREALAVDGPTFLWASDWREQIKNEFAGGDAP